jgi:hypothetical protein
MFRDVSDESEMIDQMAILAEVSWTGTDVLKDALLAYYAYTDGSPSKREEYVAPALGDTDAPCNVFPLEIRDNRVCNLWYLEWVSR